MSEGFGGLKREAGVPEAAQGPAGLDLLLQSRASDAFDAQVRLAVMEALHWELTIPPQGVAVEVNDGWVVLRGSLARAHSRHRAEWAARGAPGVAGVTNAITLEG
jgi:osmotically-inducible protein OsmY